MSGSGGPSTGARAPRPAAPDSSWPRIVLYTILFQFAWHWRKLPELFREGALPDTDDFLHLMQVRNWMAGQGWYDLAQWRMDPPAGGDVHWSRLLDVPVAALIAFFDLFTDTVTAERLAALVWPTLLLVATVLVVVAVCRATVARFNPLLAVLFTVLCFTALTEFMPGRLDHHGVQILLFSLMLLGLARGAARWGHVLTGAAMAASTAIGLDAILLVVAILGWLGVAWVLGRDGNGRGLARTAAGLAGTALLLFPLDIAPAQWLAARCDANSVVYLAAFLAIAAAFAVLAAGTSRLTAATPAGTFALRLAAGAVLAALVAGGLYALFPQCAAGPYGAMSQELRTRWLVNVHEARGLLTMVETVPALWLSGLAYALLLVGIGAIVVWRRGHERPALIAVYATFVLSVAAMFLQYRALRIGIFASIPLCVAFAAMAWQWLEQRFAGRRLVAGALQAAIIVALLSPTWLIAGTILFPGAPGAPAAGGGSAARPDRPGLPQWKREAVGPFCNRESQFAALQALPKGLVMNDINSGPSILVFTDHSVIGGPYHRNERAILDMTDFFETDLEKPRRIARERGIDYVAWCDPGDLDGPEYAGNPALAARLARGETPNWLARVSAPEDRFQVFTVVPPRKARAN